MCSIVFDFPLTSKSFCHDKHLDNCSGIGPTDMQKQESNVNDRGPESKCSDERNFLEKIDNYLYNPGDVVNISVTQDGGVVLLDSDTDDRWSSELDNMPLLVRREMLVKDDEWSSELDNMPLSLRMEMLLMSKQSPRTDSMHSSVSPASERSLMTNHDAPLLEEEEKLLNNSVKSSHKPSDIPGECYIERDAVIQYNDPLNKEKMHPDACNVSAINTANGASSSETKSVTLNPCNEPGRNQMSTMLISYPSKSTAEVNVKIKVEPTMHDEEMSSSKSIAAGDFKFGTVMVKTEENSNSDISDDKIDQMLLQERMKLLTSPVHSDSFKRTSMPDMSPGMGTVKPISIKRPWKRKRTATDSVEVALEEDAPGLLRALADTGVTVDEIKLYENEEENELADEEESSETDSFSKLEDVIAQLFSDRQPLIKMGHPRNTKDAKATYCLACLFALVEQTRYLQSRNWPVEWGWSRDLQSFIFVFKRHRRIVLERPEYGYATYFFELIDSLSVKWQIKRLVTAMKLATCGRTTLIENRALLIGEDLTEGEARVLTQFGWTPNSGLGTMLNYASRVVHDKRNEKDTSEWRSKIGRLLIDGYNGGSIVSVDTIENAESYWGKIKQEL